MEVNTQLTHQLEITLSYLEPMSLEYIYLDLDKDFLKKNPALTMEDLQSALISLKKQKKIKTLRDKNQDLWIKVYPKKSIWQKLKTYFR